MDIFWRRHQAPGALGLDVLKNAMNPPKDIMLAASGRVDKPPDAKTAEDKQVEGAWYESVKRYVHLKRAGVPVAFSSRSSQAQGRGDEAQESAAKRQRL